MGKGLDPDSSSMLEGMLYKLFRGERYTFLLYELEFRLSSGEMYTLSD